MNFKSKSHDHECSRWSAEKKKKHTQIPVIKQQNTSNATFLISVIITKFDYDNRIKIGINTKEMLCYRSKDGTIC